MRKTFTIFSAVVLLFLIVAPVMASPWHWGGGERIIGKDEVIKGDLIFQGERLEIDGTVEGDLLVLAGDVVINGQVNGSVLGMIYQKLTLDGTIGQSLRVLAGEVVINGKVDGSFTGLGLTYKAASASTVNGVLGAFNQWKSVGLIDGPVEITSQLPPQIGGRIKGDVKIKGTPPEWSVPLTIDGKVLDYTTPSNRPKDKRIMIKNGYSHQEEPAGSGIVAKGLFLIQIVWFIGSLLICLIFFRLFPRSAWAMTEPSGRNFKRGLLIGVLTIIGFLILIGILVFTVVGIPLAVLLGLIFMILLLFSNVPVYLWLGRLVLPRLRPTLAILAGGVLVLLLGFFPSPIDGLMNLVLSCLGFGMIIGNIKFQVHEV